MKAYLAMEAGEIADTLHSANALLNSLRHKVVLQVITTCSSSFSLEQEVCISPAYKIM